MKIIYLNNYIFMKMYHKDHLLSYINSKYTGKTDLLPGPTALTFVKKSWYMCFNPTKGGTLFSVSC